MLPAMSPPLIVTAEAELLDELLRLAAAAGVTPEVAADPGAALCAWTAAPLVVIGLDQAERLLRLGPARRPGLVLATWDRAGEGALRTALALGVAEVVELPKGGRRLVEQLTELEDPLSPGARLLGVVAGSGGAGATTFACALGQHAARAGPALVVDADPLGPGLDRVLGLEDEPGVRWSDLVETSGHLSGRSLRDALPRRDGPAVLTWTGGRVDIPPPAAVREVLSSARRGHDLVVLDLPRSEDPLVDELSARCDQLVVMTRPTVLSLASAARVCARFPRTDRQIVVRGRGVDHATVTEVTGVSNVLVMGDQRRLDEWVDLGLGPLVSRRGALAKAVAAILDTVSEPRR